MTDIVERLHRIYHEACADWETTPSGLTDALLDAKVEIERMRAQTVSLTHPELEEAIKHVTAYDDCQMGMLEWTKVWRLVVAARQYVWMLKRSEEAADEIERLRSCEEAMLDGVDLSIELKQEIERLRAHVVSLQSSLDAGPPRPGKKTPDALEREE